MLMGHCKNFLGGSGSLWVVVRFFCRVADFFVGGC